MIAPTGAVVAGVGTSHFGRFPTKRVEQLAWEAALEAVDDAGVEPGRIEALYVGSVFGPPGLAARIGRAIGITGVPVYHLEAACASGTVAFHEAVAAVASGRLECALAVGVEQLSSRFAGPIAPEPADPEGRAGLALPALYALQAQRYIHDHGASAADIASVAVKNKRHGLLNPRAHLRNAPSLEEVLESRPIADPLTLLQCCPMTDGAAAAVIRRARAAPSGVTVRASAFVTGRAWSAGSGEHWSSACVSRAGGEALDAARVSVADIDLFEIHDAFTIGEVITIEALGLCGAGKGAGLSAEGATSLDGRWPVNPSGGLLSRGHPLGGTGLAQVAEACWQLRGGAERRQVRNARLALVETMGGGASGLEGNAAVVTVLEAPT